MKLLRKIIASDKVQVSELCCCINVQQAHGDLSHLSQSCGWILNLAHIFCGAFGPCAVSVLVDLPFWPSSSTEGMPP